MIRWVNKSVFYFLIFVFFVEVLLLGSRYLDKNEEPVAPANNLLEHKSDQKMEKIHLVEGLGSLKEWELYADSAEGFMGQGVWNLTKVKVIFYAKTGDSYVVQGKRGQIDGSKNIDIVGDVSTRSSNGYDFKTSSLHYKSATKVMSAPEKLRLQGPKDSAGNRLHLQGRGISTFLENSLMNIENDVIADRMMSNGKNLKIQSNKAQLSGRSNLVRFYESVKMYYDTFSIQGPEALFAYQTGDSDLPKSIIINGGVQVADLEKNATGENLQIDVNDDKYILRGSPKVIQGADELRGEEIIFLEGGKKVKVESIKANVKGKEGEQR